MVMSPGAVKFALAEAKASVAPVPAVASATTSTSPVSEILPVPAVPAETARSAKALAEDANEPLLVAMACTVILPVTATLAAARSSTSASALASGVAAPSPMPAKVASATTRISPPLMSRLPPTSPGVTAATAERLVPAKMFSRAFAVANPLESMEPKPMP